MKLFGRKTIRGTEKEGDYKQKTLQKKRILEVRTLPTRGRWAERDHPMGNSICFIKRIRINSTR